MPNNVTAVAAAPGEAAVAHFEAEFTFETDCWDVHDALSSGADDFVLLDVRSPALFAAGHVPGAVNLPHGKIIGSKMAAWPDGDHVRHLLRGSALQRRGARRAPSRQARSGR